MVLNIVGRMNWVDVLVIILLFRICYISMRKGLTIELFKLLGTVTAIYLSLHYYTLLSDFFRTRFGLKIIPLKFLDFLSSFLLAIIGYAAFVALREAIHRFIKMESAPELDRWGGLFFGVGRGILFVGLVCFLLVISSIGYFKKSVGASYLGQRAFKVAPRVYAGLWNSFMSKFMSQEKFNETVSEIQQDFDNQ